MENNVYCDAVCPECEGEINYFGFCTDCGFDFEEYLTATDEMWAEYEPD